jgi:molecular chaperone GrpE (heat shock protein)
MRESVHEHRIDTPKTAQRLGQIVNDVDGSNVMYRLNRSAAEIYTGRVREAAPREGLITETLETLAQELREAASQAGQEAKNSGEQQSPDALLADVAELRRAVQQAQRARQGKEGNGKEGNGKEGQAKQGQAADSKSGDGRPPAEGSDAAGDSQSAGAQSDTRSASAQSAGGGGLSAWNPAATNGALRAREYGYSLARETGEIDRRVRDFSQRMNNVQLSAAEINSLRRMANELRRLAGDPMASYTEEMIKVIDQIELAALSVADKAKPSAPARASVTMPESVEYREAVAEYYRRLGGS